MKQQVRKGAHFAKVEGSPSWRDRLATLKAKAKGDRRATAKLEVDDANGEKLIFSEIGDIAEIAEGVSVTATDGPHVFTADTTTYSVEVLDGKIASITKTPIDDGAEMSAETSEFLEAVATALADAEEFKATAAATIATQAETIATMQADFKAFKALMGHKDDKIDGAGGAKKEFKIAGKSIDLSKINMK